MERKKAAITGGEVGMGRGIALVLAEEGYDIAFSCYPNAERAESTVETMLSLLRERGAKGWPFPEDLSKPDAPRAFFEKTVASLGGLELMVNNAGVNIRPPIQDTNGVTIRVDGGLILPGMPEDTSMLTQDKGW
ncbi:MAG: SDR family NAD(P)-dependent oxidoreductase [Oscillospiraceae bacterium]|nr:SDR family NAD(P)-dependent oxidoreductase [Oscillospiraceae bacterium]